MALDNESLPDAPDLVASQGGFALYNHGNFEYTMVDTNGTEIDPTELKENKEEFNPKSHISALKKLVKSEKYDPNQLKVINRLVYKWRGKDVAMILSRYGEQDEVYRCTEKNFTAVVKEGYEMISAFHSLKLERHGQSGNDRSRKELPRKSQTRDNRANSDSHFRVNNHQHRSPSKYISINRKKDSHRRRRENTGDDRNESNESVTDLYIEYQQDIPVGIFRNGQTDQIVVSDKTGNCVMVKPDKTVNLSKLAHMTTKADLRFLEDNKLRPTEYEVHALYILVHGARLCRWVEIKLKDPHVKRKLQKARTQLDDKNKGPLRCNWTSFQKFVGKKIAFEIVADHPNYETFLQQSDKGEMKQESTPNRRKGKTLSFGRIPVKAAKDTKGNSWRLEKDYYGNSAEESSSEESDEESDEGSDEESDEESDEGSDEGSPSASAKPYRRR
ncbi:hypothetical protein BS50DRAFT_641192 [Corynespora cassiicola Philippines]|uniref:Uncharacterized protein n=1 Tax=Corynespora cassiicola Philippines TaxID=1448308 RepID=A0A2T2N146_CORCC|nr:hypothetical protein BS50DRAFT_641192 [Corynespora cassiicola Philippines]